jgi:hypothetical protein
LSKENKHNKNECGSKLVSVNQKVSDTYLRDMKQKHTKTIYP